MARKRAGMKFSDYKELHHFSSVVLYNDSTCRAKGKVYPVERIITRKKQKNDFLYLIKWAGWPLQQCSWEPSWNLPEHLLRGYEQPPKPSPSQLEEAARALSCGILTMLKSKSFRRELIGINHDVWRYVIQGKGRPSEHKGYQLFDKDDFAHLAKLPSDWWYFLNELGEGRKLDFPIKAKAVITWSAQKYVINNEGNISAAARFPLERISVYIASSPCKKENLHD